ncbi:hypothetical protein FQA47_024859 [Oryzias melastigma]|uniref:Uncharacterized protein n=1 Tax=Oryzias melastigma TaxID=30732 RepID=A0A834FKA1_ORYME|nr:hypothetical protein FQA47_024859 [Oryzias melastigma]
MIRTQPDAADAHREGSCSFISRAGSGICTSQCLCVRTRVRGLCAREGGGGGVSVGPLAVIGDGSWEGGCRGNSRSPSAEIRTPISWEGEFFCYDLRRVRGHHPFQRAHLSVSCQSFHAGLSPCACMARRPGRICARGENTPLDMDERSNIIAAFQSL